MEATITSKGQLVLPKGIRDLLKVGPGDKVDFVVEADGRVVVHPATLDFRSLKGMVKSKRQTPASIEEMNRTIREHVVREYRRACP